MNSKMHQFTIDYITREGSDSALGADSRGMNFTMCRDASADKGYNRKNSRQTPSPSDSGMESDHSPAKCGAASYQDEEGSIADVMLSLEKTAAKLNRKDSTDAASDDKPSHSYIALISMAILSSCDRKMLLCDIYQYIMDNFAYYNNEEKAWRNSIRHNLSLNECFVKAGRADNGKGNYWAIHPACVDDFAKGDFRRRQARRRARKCQKDTSQSDMRNGYGFNTGYVPMTASHIAYHPYGATAPQLYYPQSSSLHQSISHPQTSPSSSFPSSTSSSPKHVQSNTLHGEYLSPCSLSASPNPTSGASTTSMSAAAQRFWAEQANTTMFTMQALAQQQIASSLQFQNW